MTPTDRRDLAWAILLARLILGLIFAAAGEFKVFDLGPLEHARQLFVEPYADTVLPRWALWTAGTIVPIVELGAGGLLLLGLFTRSALFSLGCALAIVTFGHVLKEPLYEFHVHVIPRTGLVLFLLATPRAADYWGVDAWWLRRRSIPATINGAS